MLSIVLLVAVAFVNYASAGSQEWVDAHNADRRKEDADDMIEMSWNQALADNAQKVVDKCVFAHSSLGDRSNKGGHDYVGENLWMGTGYTSVNEGDVVDAWWNEKKDYSFQDITCSAVCGHYTQVVWATTKEVGCAQKECSGNRIIVACQYGPGGNYRGEHPYEKGSPCSDCPSGYTCDQGLCVSGGKKRGLFAEPLARALGSRKRSHFAKPLSRDAEDE